MRALLAGLLAMATTAAAQAEPLLARQRLPDVTSMGAMVAVEGYALFFGGSTSRDVTSQQVLMIDPATGDAWDFGHLPTGMRYQAAAATDMDIYLFGGVHVGEKRRQWSIRATAEAPESLPVYDVFQLVDERFARRTAGAAAVGNEIVLGGGGVLEPGRRSCVDGMVRTSSFMAFDTVTGDMTELPPLPIGREGAIAAIDDTVWVVGGFDGCRAINRVWMISRGEAGWDSEWTDFGLLPAPVSAHALTAADDELFLFGDYEQLDRVWRIDTVGLTVHEIPESGYFPRRHAAAATIGDRIVVAGGNSSTNASRRVRYYDAIEVFSVEGLRAASAPLGPLRPAPPLEEGR
ncbi:MAG: hypothetical protein AAGE01_18095 [Pseudomonadota bacterium]